MTAQSDERRRSQAQGPSEGLGEEDRALQVIKQILLRPAFHRLSESQAEILRDMLLAARAQRPQPEGEWRPFDRTVPSDGTWFEARCPVGEGWQVRTVHYADRYDRLPISDPGVMWETEPTHWRPLAPTPKPEGVNGELLAALKNCVQTWRALGPHAADWLHEADAAIAKAEQIEPPKPTMATHGYMSGVLRGTKLAHLAALQSTPPTSTGSRNTTDERPELPCADAPSALAPNSRLDGRGLVPPHYDGTDKYDRHPKAADWFDPRKDPMGEHLQRGVRRLNFACDLADPRAPDQMAVVCREDLMRVLGQLTWRTAQSASRKAQLEKLAAQTDGALGRHEGLVRDDQNSPQTKAGGEA